VPRGFKVNIDGDRIAGRKRFVQRLVKQVILMCYRGWKRFLRIFRGEHDFAAFFTFLSSVYGVFAPATKGERTIARKAHPNRAFGDRNCYLKEPWQRTAWPAWKRRQQGSDQGYGHPTKAAAREQGGNSVGCEISSPAQKYCRRRPRAHPYHGRFVLTQAASRRLLRPF
jgi:hypothetical protein